MENMLAINNRVLENNRQLLVELVRRFGGTAADAVLDPTCKIYVDPNIQGVIGYRIENNYAVVYGNPICSIEDAPALAQSFENFCTSKGWSTIYLGVTGPFAEWAKETICKIQITFGYELYLDPHNDPQQYTGVNASLVRRKVRHAQKENTTVEEYKGNDPAVEAAIENVATLWLQGRKGAQVHISHVRLFENRYGKRWFYAKQGENIVGVLVLNQLEAKEGWLLNHVMFIPTAPHGTPEILVVTALAALASEGCHFVTFGNVSKNDVWEIKGLGKFSTWAAENLLKLLKGLFHLEGHYKFWEKFHPSKEFSYLMFRDSTISLNLLMSLKKALNMHIKLPGTTAKKQNTDS